MHLLSRSSVALPALALMVTLPAVAQPVTVVKDAGELLDTPAGVTFARTVTVYAAAFRDAAAARTPIIVQVGDARYQVAADRISMRPDGISWSGTTLDGGRAMLTLEGTHLVGRLVTRDGLLLIEPHAAGHIAYRPGQFPEHEDDAVPAPQDQGPAALLPPETLFPDELHLMIAYTPALAAVLGAGLPAFLQAAEDVVNDVLDNSLVPVDVRLVHTHLVQYTESGNMSTDLSRIRSTSDGHMDEVHAIRDAYSADLVALLVQSAGSSCGVAYLMDPIRPEFHPSGFSVTLRSCAIGNLTLPHELGHNIGLRHDRFVDGNNTPFTYSHGFVNDDSLNTPPGTPGYRTTLAYNNECTSQGGTCIRVPYFSSPTLMHLGHVLGDSVLAHNARAAEFALPTIAEFRAPVFMAEDDGNTVGAPVWQRPDCPNPEDLTACVVGDSSRWISRSVNTTTAGLHHLRIDASFDAVAALYAGFFDAEQPLDRLVGYSVPDSTAPAIRHHLLSHPLSDSTGYTLVITGRDIDEAGAFEMEIYGPGGGIVVPGPDRPETAGDFEVGRPAPNPFVGSTTLALSVGAAQHVRAELLDVLGRRIAILYDAPLEASARHALRVDGAGLSPGVYVVRVAGETFQATRRVVRGG